MDDAAWLGPALAALVVEHYDKRGHFDARIAAQAVTALAGRPLPARFAWLLAQHLAGTLKARRGDAQSFSNQRLVRHRFNERRAAGASHDVVMAELIGWSGQSRPTIEKWLHHTK